MTEVAPHDMTAEYQGETHPRRRWTAIGLTFLSPGLGYMYSGHLLKGITANLCFVLILEIFVISLSIFKFFPLFPIAVLALGWLVFSSLAASHVLELLPEDPDGYVVKPYNHWVLYGIVAILTYITPVAVTSHFTSSHLWSVNTMNTAAMYPGLQPGDTVLIDRMVYKKNTPERGDLVAIEVPQSSEMLILRVVGVPDDEIRVEGYNIYLNDEPVQHSPLRPEFIQHAEVENTADLYAWVEHNNERSYVIALSPRVFAETTIPAMRIESSQYFLLADNRSQLPLANEEGFIRDSRIFGTITKSQIIGRPLYIAWSTSPDDAQIRWDRMGLRLD
ncbi:MAG: signal peptidase I [Bradymonadaceae bacterium]